VPQHLGEQKRSKYRLLGLIGQGQFGQVFCAIHRQTGRLVALKNLEQDRFPTHKFLRELRFLLSLQHPNIVTFQSLEHTPTGRYLVMDYCEGGTLRSLLTEESRPSLPYSIRLVADVLAGLEQAHERGIVHCDIKPENILLHVHGKGWTARISDFGIARLSQEMTQQDSPAGSPAYMAPERFYGQYSISSDLYSVGILLFELIAGYRPFSGTPAELMSAHLNTPVQLPAAIPVAWRPIIIRALQKLPARRFHSAAEMLTEIRAVAGIVATDSQIPLTQPCFFAATDLAESPFQSQHQELVHQRITDLAVTPRRIETAFRLGESEPVTAPFETVRLLQATGHHLKQQTYHADWLIPTQSKQPAVEIATTSEPVEHLLIRPQGCYVVTRRSVGVLTVGEIASGSGQPNFQPARLAPLAAWTEDCWATIDPTGRWLARLPLTTDGDARSLKFLRLLGHQGFQLAASVPLAQPNNLDLYAGQATHLLALDARHLAILTAGTPLAATLCASEEATGGTQIQIMSRRGDTLGSLWLALRLQRVVLTSTPYQLLATDEEQTGTALLIDLMPYRVRRLWVTITPDFLAATAWGYILAESQGAVVFLDQAGRLIGATTSPAPIVAMAPVQSHGLLIATWDGAAGNLYSLDLRLLGLDLVF
jgi:serine/threonine-protein kinase